MDETSVQLIADEDDSLPGFVDAVGGGSAAVLLIGSVLLVGVGVALPFVPLVAVAAFLIVWARRRSGTTRRRTRRGLSGTGAGRPTLGASHASRGMVVAEPVVLYEEKGSVAIITLNRPEKMNTLTESVIAGVADGIDKATASRPIRSVILRGSGRTLTAGYDLDPDDSDDPLASWGSPYDAPGPRARDGAWDPVRDMQFMGQNVKRFMKIWECPKPVLGQIHGWAVGGATDLILCCLCADRRVGPARDSAGGRRRPCTPGGVQPTRIRCSARNRPPTAMSHSLNARRPKPRKEKIDPL